MLHQSLQRNLPPESACVRKSFSRDAKRGERLTEGPASMRRGEFVSFSLVDTFAALLSPFPPTHGSICTHTKAPLSTWCGSHLFLSGSERVSVSTFNRALPPSCSGHCAQGRWLHNSPTCQEPLSTCTWTSAWLRSRIYFPLIYWTVNHAVAMRGCSNIWLK